MMLPMEAGIESLEYLRVLKMKAEDASQKARASYESYFKKKMRRVLVFGAGGWVYVDNTPNLSKKETGTVTKDHSRKLMPKKDGAYKVINVMKNTVTVDSNGIHNVVSIDCVTLSAVAKAETADCHE